MPGFRFIWRKFVPERVEIVERHKYRKPSTLLLWLASICIALYGIASTRYESALDRVENRLNIVIAQLPIADEKIFEKLISQISQIQQAKTPLESILPQEISLPAFRDSLYSIYHSFSRKEPNKEIKESIINILRTWMRKLVGLRLEYIDFSGTKFEVNEDLSGISILGANFSGVRTFGAKFTGADLFVADFSGSSIVSTDFSNAKLIQAKFKKVYFRDVRFHKAIFYAADFSDIDIEGENPKKGFESWVDFSEAELGGANFSGADLGGAYFYRANLGQTPGGLIISGEIQRQADPDSVNLSGIRNWKRIIGIKDANIYGIRNAPEGFREWALANGAVEMDMEKWKAFKESGYKKE